MKPLAPYRLKRAQCDVQLPGQPSPQPHSCWVYTGVNHVYTVIPLATGPVFLTDWVQVAGPGPVHDTICALVEQGLMQSVG